MFAFSDLLNSGLVITHLRLRTRMLTHLLSVFEARRFCFLSDNLFRPSKATANPTIGKHHGPLYRCQSCPRHYQERRAKQLDCAAIVEPQHLGDSQERADNIIITPNDKMYL